MSQGPTSNRREFLQGEAARRAAESFATGFREELPKIPLPPSGADDVPLLVRYARDAMAVEFQAFVPVHAARSAGAGALEALELLEPLEAQLTIYRESSEVSEINRRAFSDDVLVEESLFALFTQALAISHDTQGAYDMTSGPLSKLWGFYRRAGRMPGDEEIAATLPRVGYRNVELNASERTIRFRVEGMELNLGGIGKGYALDRLAEACRAGGLNHVLLHGGHSSVYAAGRRSPPDNDDARWRVGLTHPLKPSVRLAEFYLHEQALGTSGSGTQFFHYQGKRYGHVLDPRSGRPADAVLSSTVIAPTAAAADALSTAFYVGGVELAREYCRTHPEVAALLVQVRSGMEVELCPVNLAENAWRKLPGAMGS
jgi:thiamine biosynthesis lipoprotein